MNPSCVHGTAVPQHNRTSMWRQAHGGWPKMKRGELSWHQSVSTALRRPPGPHAFIAGVNFSTVKTVKTTCVWCNLLNLQEMGDINAGNPWNLTWFLGQKSLAENWKSAGWLHVKYMYIHYCPGLIEVYSLKQNMWLGLGHPRNEGRVQSSCLHLVYKATVLYILCSE